MAVQRIVPIGDDATYNEWTQGGGSSKWGNMDPSDPNGFSSSYISYTSTGTHYQGFTKTVPAPRLSITSWVNTIGGGKNANMAQTSYGLYRKGFDWVIGPSASWFNVFVWDTQVFSNSGVPSDVQIDDTNTILLCYNVDDDGTHPSYVNYFYADFTYTPVDMSFISIWNLVLPVMGAMIQLRDMARINAWLMRNTSFRFERRELEEAFRQIKNYRFPTHYDRGLWLPKVA